MMVFCQARLLDCYSSHTNCLCAAKGMTGIQVPLVCLFLPEDIDWPASHAELKPETLAITDEQLTNYTATNLSLKLASLANTL